MKKKFIRPLWQRTVAMTMAMLLLAGTAYSNGMTSHASATDLWADDMWEDEPVDGSSEDLSGSLFDDSGSSDFDLFGDGTEEGSDELLGSDDDYSEDGDLFGDEGSGELFDEPAEDPVITASMDDVTVTVTGSADVLEDIETVHIEEMGEERVAAWQEMFNVRDDGDTEYIVSAVYDITLTDWNGNEAEPYGDVTVSLTGEKVAAGIAGRMDLQVYHAYDMDPNVSLFSMNAGRMSEDAVEELSVYEQGMDTVVFDTGSFSEYALVLTGNASQKEVAFGNNEYIELDKYLQKTGELNGQNTYDIYLEQAYYDPNPGIKLPNAPLKSDWFLVLDHSASMSGAPIVRLNQALDNFLNEMKATNQLRAKRAARGEYYDIDPASVALTNADGTVQTDPATGDPIMRSDADIRSAMGEHLMYLTGSVMYNNHTRIGHSPSSRVAFLTDSEVDYFINLDSWTGTDGPSDNKDIFGSGVLRGWPDYGLASVCLQDMTRTDQGTKVVYDWIMGNLGNYSVTTATGKQKLSARIVLATDGAPAGYSPEGVADGYATGNHYDWGGRFSYALDPDNANQALTYINNLKSRGATSYVSYVNVSSDPDAKAILDNLENQYGATNVPIQVVWNSIMSRPIQSATSIFMLLYSQCAYGGRFLVRDSDGDGDNDIYNITFDNNSIGYTPTFFRFHNNAGDIPTIDDFISQQDIIDWEDGSNNSGYASMTSYVLDEITDPFEITSQSGIQVYAVPRIPTNLDADGRPRNMIEETDENGQTIYSVPAEDFRWGERIVDDGSGELGTEWVDVTDEVSIETNGQKVKVSGYNYEANAVSVYDKDQFRRWPVTGNGTVYRTGDYGYKLVIIVPINAKFSFGGNGIKTNNTDISGFYPSEPTRSDLPKWEDNTALNPGKEEYMELYPEIKVDLNMYYDVTSDNATIYAPQTQKLHDLVTDSLLNSIWYADPNYSELLTLRDNAKMLYDMADKALKASNDSQPIGDPDAYAAWVEENGKLVAEKNAAWNDYIEAQANLETVSAYIPDGINNAFVNIDYQLIDPDGIVVGTMHVPHGKAYVLDANGKGNIDWTFTNGANAEIQKSGVYKVKATVTPVATTQSPSWHVYTEADSADIQAIIGHSSLQYSPTGSSATGSQSAITKEKDALAKIFVLQITVDDSRQERNETIDFADLTGQLRTLINNTRYNKHIVSYAWVSENPALRNDKTYQSITKEEPGVTGVVKVGSDVNFTATVPEQALADGLAQYDADLGITTITAPDGGYVPAAVMLTRQVGNLNKDADPREDRKLVVMSDTDAKYGAGKNSVIWTHECTVITDYDCQTNDFATAVNKYPGSEAAATEQGKVRFIVHVMENPNIVPVKSTTTPAIPKGADIEWEVAAINNDLDTNPTRRESEFSLWDILPYSGDDRLDPLTNHEGSKTNTDLYYKTIEVDYSQSAKAQLYLSMGKGAFWYTTDVKVRNCTDLQKYDDTADGAIKWVKVNGTHKGGNVYSYAVPNNAIAVKLDTLVGWEEGVTIDMVANVKNMNAQQAGDYYHNEARTYNGKFGYNSNVVATLVTNLFVSGTVWVDDDNNGIMTAEEPRKDRIKVTLYQLYNPKNPLDEANVRTIGGIKLVPAYDTDYYQYPTVYTDSSGTFLFDDIQQGTYYVVADYIPDEYQVTAKKAGEGQGATALLDSEAETDFVASEEAKYAEDGNTAWVKEIKVTNSPIEGQNIGLKNIRGTVKVGKTLDEIYFPSSMTDEERADYNVPFVFVLRHTGTGATYTQEVFLNEENMHLMGGQPQVWTEFTDLPLGTYELTEVHDAQYKIVDINGNSTNVRFNAGAQKATINVTPEEYEYTVYVENGIDRDPPGGDENGVVNWVNMKIPVKLEIKYSGDAVISNQAITEYTFTAEDFNPRAGGDMIVTYDDGSTISISEGTLRFDQVSLTPATVTNAMNTKDGKLLTVTGYYAEKGRLLTDSFRVGVDLKPIHKFDITFYSNGSTFDNGGTANNVGFIYDDQQQKNFVSHGTYKDVPNGGLKELADFQFAGWATMPDGTGTHFGTLGGGDALDALNALGMDMSYDGGELYADWKTHITFDAQSGGITTGTINDLIDGYEVGQQVVQVRKSLNSMVPDTLSGSKSGYQFVMWNTEPDGTGLSIKQYNEAGGVKSPVTFYAIYYKSDYAYTGSVQTFTAPVSGIYEVTLYGARGNNHGSNNYYGKGGSVSGTVHIDVTTQLNIYVGGINRYNGGGAGGGSQSTCGVTGCGLWANGGGATDIRTATNGLDNRIMVAGGGGGASNVSHEDNNYTVCVAGHGGGWQGGNGRGDAGHENHLSIGATQYAGGTSWQGYGGTGAFGVASWSGGGGWYGGAGGWKHGAGSGGSSYAEGSPYCNPNYDNGYTVNNAATSTGVNNGHGSARIILIEIDN